MDMFYRILWIDDNIDDLDGHIRLLDTSVKQLGFEVQIKYFNDITAESIEKLVKDLKASNTYDLIIADYDLGNKIGGVKVLKKIRTTHHNKMVLYSATPVPTLRQLICDERFDGVFCMSRTGLKNQLLPLIEVDIRKINIPPFIRGLFIGAVSEIDALLADILFALTKNKEQETILSIRDRYKNFLESELQHLDSKYSKQLERVLRDLNFHQKKELALPILEQIGCHVSSNCAESINNFMDKINPIRIDLAHFATSESGGIPVLKRKSGGEYNLSDLNSLLLLANNIKLSLANAKEHFSSTSGTE